MRHGSWALAAGAGLVGSCAIPNTLGLPCITHAHCDPGQHCGPDQVCVDGMPPMMEGTGPTFPTFPDGSGSTTGVTSGTTVVIDGTSSGDGTSASTTAQTTGSTGAACGEAVGSCDAVDVLFVVDNSGSMEDDNAQLIPAFGNVNELVGPLIAGPCTYRIGVTTTETAPDFQPAECQVRGAMSRAGAICADPFGDPEHPPWVSEADDISTLGCLLAVGTNYDTDEKQLETTIESLGPELQGPGGCNEGFLRPDAILVLVVVTDDPPFPDTPDDAWPLTDATVWRDAVVDAKGGNLESIVVIGIVPWDDTSCVCPWCCPGWGCMAPHDNAIEFVEAFGEQGVLASVCSDNYAPVFADTIETIDTTCALFDPPE